MKKLSIFIYSLASGGAERQVSILLQELHKKYEIYLVLMNDTIFYEVPKNIKIVYLEKSSPTESGIKKLLKLPLLALKYRKFLLENEIDISLSFLTRPNYINCLTKLYLSKSRKKVILFEGSFISMQYNYKNLSSIINNRLIMLYNYSDLIVPASKYVGYDLKKNYKIKVEQKTIYAILDISNINEKKNMKIAKDRFTFVTIGRLDKGKNHQLLIEAIKDIDADLWIIGDGYLREDLELRIENLGLKDRVKLLGRQKNVYKFLDKADCFVFSSNHEGFPNVLLEALACELPVISTDCPSGPREILAPGSDFTRQTTDIKLAEYGMLVPVGNVEKMRKAMKMMKEDKELRQRYSKKALKRANDFKIDKIIKKWESVLDG